MSKTLSTKSSGVLTYGTVDLCLYNLYKAGSTIRIHNNLFLEVVDRVEKADGIIVLGLVPNEIAKRRPICLSVLFTHYYRKQHFDVVDHAETVLRLTQPSEAIRHATERVFTIDLVTRSVAASLAMNPSVRYLT
jgi:hypothetical protein